MDWEKTDCLIVMGVNASSNAPRMITSLAEAYRRGAQVVHINPLVEAAATRTIVPHECWTDGGVPVNGTSTLNMQPRIAGDMAADARHRESTCSKPPKPTRPPSTSFSSNATPPGSRRTARCVEAVGWDELEQQSGVPAQQSPRVGRGVSQVAVGHH